MLTQSPPFEDIIQFWFVEAGPKHWWKKSDAFDDLVRQRFLPTYEQALVGETDEWRCNPYGRLAEIIVLDQFPRHMFRHTAGAFEADNVALVLAQEAVRAEADQALSIDERPFLYMPFMHSESVSVHQKALQLFAADGMGSNLDFEKKHLAILERFGRYPHRNAILKRDSTPEELAFLKEPGSGF